ncbi:hypothetical protein PoB_004805000 [Plakobranchus ocellatus]|uniref:Uncharacterized protein n=1 Tax=Plakobranchus ocellatus TaxID=259542 RepID=A0AAV4BQ04_9GAST|nr:hypothetical protein PoB_004805000 [Plakobranchus ocellatus]
MVFFYEIPSSLRKHLTSVDCWPVLFSISAGKVHDSQAHEDRVRTILIFKRSAVSSRSKMYSVPQFSERSCRLVQSWSLDPSPDTIAPRNSKLWEVLSFREFIHNNVHAVGRQFSLLFRSACHKFSTGFILIAYSSLAWTSISSEKRRIFPNLIGSL